MALLECVSGRFGVQRSLRWCPKVAPLESNGALSFPRKTWLAKSTIMRRYNRSMRFGISYYTIWNIVLYDSVKRCPVWPKPGWWGGARPLATCKPPLTLPRACRWMFVVATSVTPADGEVHWPWCGLRLCLTIWYIVKCVCFVRLFPCFSIGFSVLGVWHCDTCICKF